MKTINTVILLAFCLLPSSFRLIAAPVPWIGELSDGTQNSIVIPAGKVLVIEQISSPTATSLSVLRVSGSPAGGIGTSGFSYDIRFGAVGSSNLLTLTAPLRLGPGMTLTRISTNSVALFGVAMDSQDFYASLNPVIRDVMSDGSRMTAIVDARTTAPTRISGESSTNLAEWTPAGVSVAPSASNPRFSRLTTSADTSSKYLRAWAARKSAVGNSN